MKNDWKQIFAWEQIVKGSNSGVPIAPLSGLSYKGERER